MSDELEKLIERQNKVAEEKINNVTQILTELEQFEQKYNISILHLIRALENGIVYKHTDKFYYFGNLLLSLKDKLLYDGTEIFPFDAYGEDWFVCDGYYRRLIANE